ncbi:hypothetical protein Tco_1365743, partial [Tanacetum coccineum]
MLYNLHTTPPNEDYEAPATKSILDELLEEFRDKILNITMVDEGADFNPNKDIQELEKLLANDLKQHYMEIQVNSVIINPKPFIHTQPMNPLYGIFKSCKSSTKPYKVDREMKSPFRYVPWKPSRDFTRPLGPPSGLKGLLHTLNATVIPMK